MDMNGWVTIDFMVAFTIIILTIPSITAIISDRVDTSNSVHELVEAKILEENIAEIVEMVYSGGVGCSIIFKMASKIANKPYSLTINSSGVYVMLKNNIGTVFITPMKMTDGKFYTNILLEPNKTYNILNIKYRDNYNGIIIKKI
jgi:hypothetical protein